MSKKCILFVIPGLHHGGTNRVLSDILTLLDKKKYELTILSLRPRLMGDELYFSTFSNHSRLLFLPTFYAWAIASPFTSLFHYIINRFLRINFPLRLLCELASSNIENKISPDLVVAFEESLPSLFCQYFDCPKISWIHCDYKFFYNTNKPNLQDEKEKYSHYKNIVCVSSYTARSFCSFFPELFGKVQAIHNPIDYSRIGKMANQPIDDSNYNTDSFTILSIGRYTDVKQFHLIPDILNEMENYFEVKHKYVWYILGDGDPRLINQTKEKIANYKLKDRLFLLGTKDNPYTYLKKSNLLVNTSYSEAYPCVINEAKSLSIPVLSNRFPSVSEIIDNQTGIITEFTEMPKILCDLINDKDFLYTRLKKSCKPVDNNCEIMNQIDSLFAI